MSEAPVTLHDIFARFDAQAAAFDAHGVRAELEKFAKANPQRSEEDGKALKAELFAWGLFANNEGDGSPWGTHFGPMIQMDNREYPGLASLTPELVSYWKARSQIATHPRMRARYADATWDLEVKLNGGNRDAKFAYAAIDGYVDDCAHVGVVIRQIDGLDRALHLALKLNDAPRIAKVRDAILAFQKKVTDPTKARFVAFHFDALYPHRKRLGLSQAQIDDMIAGMEQQLAGWSDPQDSYFDPFAARELGQRLIQHYRANNRDADLKRVVQTFAKGILHVAGQGQGMFAHHWLQELHKDYLDVGLRNEADALLADIRKAGKRSAEEMEKISVPITITKDEMERFCEGITEGGVETAVSRIVGEFTPDSEHLRQEMRKQAADYPLMGMIPVTIADEFTRARAGGVQDDESGRLVMHMHQYLAFESIFLHQAIERLFSRYLLTSEQFVDLLYRSQLFEDERRLLLLAGIQHYMDVDHASCAHLLIPQIEHLLRRLMGSLGGITVSLDSVSRTYREKDLGAILRDPLMEQFWKQAAERDVALYLRVVLTDQRALNIRNRLCHGLCKPDCFTPQITDRLLHILLMLSLLRMEPGGPTSGPPETPLSEEPT